MTFQNIKKVLITELKGQGVIKASIFGSYARGDIKKNSDVDLLVKLGKGKSLLDLAGLKISLEKKLNKKVDILTYNSINPRLKQAILKDQKIIYEKRS
ncbi:nucleotidyltransferase domain-containing protein [Candidatus Gracilibacteria bacterium]|nr:nucleotidyltransferase domain-containing protein [Candidatus Gracilibacteria bacterium]